MIMLAESLPNDVILGDTNMSTVTIVDDDSESLWFYSTLKKILSTAMLWLQQHHGYFGAIFSFIM